MGCISVALATPGLVQVFPWPRTSKFFFDYQSKEFISTLSAFPIQMICFPIFRCVFFSKNLIFWLSPQFHLLCDFLQILSLVIKIVLKFVWIRMNFFELQWKWICRKKKNSCRQNEDLKIEVKPYIVERYGNDSSRDYVFYFCRFPIFFLILICLLEILIALLMWC